MASATRMNASYVNSRGVVSDEERRKGKITAITNSLETMTPKPSAIPKVISRSGKRRAFMLRQRNASMQSSSKLTERISEVAICGSNMMPRFPKENESEEKVTISDTRIAQRKMTMPTLIRPGNDASAERKISRQIKMSSTAPARYNVQ